MITLVSTAKTVDFCGNDMQYVANSDNAFSSVGHISQIRLAIGVIVNGNTYTFAFGTFSLTFVVVNYADNSGFQISAGSNSVQVAAFLNMNYLLQKYYVITSTGVLVTITSRQTGSYFALNFTSENSNIVQNENYVGTDSILQPNFKILCDIYLENINNSGTFVNVATSLYNADVNSNSIINPGKLLSKYFSDIDLPDLNQSGIKITTKTVKRYYLKLAEMYNGFVKSVIDSSVFRAIDGVINDALYSSDFDYLDYAAGNKSYLLDPSINKKETWLDAQQFLYFVNWANVTNLYVGRKVYYTDDTTVTYQGGGPVIINAVQNGCYIIPAGYTELGLAAFNPAKEIYKYDVWLNTTGDAQVGKCITYYIVPKPLYGKEFWYKNQMGGMESLLCERQIHTFDVKRSELLSNYGYDTDIDEIDDVYECSTGNKTMTEIEHISELEISDLVYVLQNGVIKQVAIEAGTYTLADENEDLYFYKFKYRIMNNKVITNQEIKTIPSSFSSAFSEAFRII